MTSEQEQAGARERMAREQLEANGITDARVLAAMRRVPRHAFVPPELRMRAYENAALPIGNGQTISQPLMVALLLSALRLSGGERVLDVGTGSGYQAALLAHMGAQVVSIERQAFLAERARDALNACGYGGILIVIGDGSEGYAPHAPYGRIVVAAGSPRVPPALIAQLAPGGRLVLPVGPADCQRLTLIDCDAAGQLTTQTEGECQFVPLIGAQGWSEP